MPPTDLDGRRLGQLVASELAAFGGDASDPATFEGTDDARGRLRVVDADRDAEPSEGGTFAYALADAATDRRVARAFLHPDRLRLDVLADRETAATAAEAAGLPVRRTPERVVVSVADGAEVKRVVPVLVAAVTGARNGAGGDPRDGPAGEGNV